MLKKVMKCDGDYLKEKFGYNQTMFVGPHKGQLKRMVLPKGLLLEVRGVNPQANLWRDGNFEELLFPSQDNNHILLVQLAEDVEVIANERLGINSDFHLKCLEAKKDLDKGVPLGFRVSYATMAWFDELESVIPLEDADRS